MQGGGMRKGCLAAAFRSEGATEHGGNAAQVHCPPLREIRLSLHAVDRRDVRARVSPACRMLRRDRPQYEIEGVAEAFIPDYRPQEILEVAQKLYAKATG